MRNLDTTEDRESGADNVFTTLRDKTALARLMLSACAFGLAMAWLQFSNDASNVQFEFDASMPWVFRQAARVPVVLILLAYPRLAAWRHANKTFLITCAAAAVASVALTMTVFYTQQSSSLLAIECGLLCGMAFGVPLARWVAVSLRASFASLFLSVSLGAIITGAVSWTMSLLPIELTAWISLLLPIGSVTILLQLGEEPSAASLLPDVARPRRNLMYFVSLIIVGGLAWSIFVDNWMPYIGLSFLLFFIPCGIVASAIVLGVARLRIASEIVFSLLVAICSIVSLFALSPLFANAIFYSAIFMSAWFLLLFALVGSVWYGSAYGEKALSVACHSVALIYLAQLLIRFVTLLFPLHDVVLLVAAVVLLVLSLVILLIAQMRALAEDQARTSSDNYEAESENERIDRLVHEYALTKRETDVLRLLAKGYSVKGIAEKLVVSENTVKFHRSNIYQKLGINSRQSLIDMIEKK